MKTAKPNSSANSASPSKAKCARSRTQPGEVGHAVKKPPAGGSPRSVETTPSDLAGALSEFDGSLLDRFVLWYELEDDKVRSPHNFAVVWAALIRSRLPEVLRSPTQDDDVLASFEDAAEILGVARNTMTFMIGERLLRMVATDAVRFRLEDVLETREEAEQVLLRLIAAAQLDEPPAAEVQFHD